MERAKVALWPVPSYIMDFKTFYLTTYKHYKVIYSKLVGIHANTNYAKVEI